jgi:hypothetical protein
MRSTQLIAATSLLTLSAGAALAAPEIGDTRVVQYLCGQTSHFRVTDGAGGFTPVVLSSSFVLTAVLEYGGPAPQASRKGYQYYKALSDMTSAGMQTNPLYQGNGNAGQSPLFDGRFAIVRPLETPAASSATDAGFYVGWSDATGHFDLWDGMPMRVQYLDDQGALVGSYVAEGLTLTGSLAGATFAVGEVQTFSFSAGTGPLKWMAPESLGRRGIPGGEPELYLESITLTMEVIPAPGAALLPGLGLLVLGRRRRR